MTEAETQAGGDVAELAWRVGRHMLASSPVVAHWGITLLDMGPGRSRLAMTVRDDMANPFGICHGGVLFTFADTSFGFACNSHNAQAVAASCDIRFLKPAAAGARLIAEAAEVWRSGRSGLYDVTVRDEAEEQVALLRGYARTLGGAVVEA